MPLLINLRHLERKALTLQGELPTAELGLETRDRMIRAARPLEFSLEAQQLEKGLLVRGRLRLVLDCQCVRCLKPFAYPLHLEDWICHLPLEGEEKAAVSGDCVDLTPYLREDIFLAFPQHPLCGAGCGGLTGYLRESENGPGRVAEHENPAATVWSELDKLKL